MTTRRILTATPLLLALAISGCLERKEKITVRPDGSVKIRIAYEGTEDDYKTLDAMPSAASGWSVTRETVAGSKDDKPKEVLSSERVFAAGVALPGSYAPPGDVEAALFTAFPTSLRIERRSDGTYYYFQRVYQPRRWAFVRYWHDRFVNDEIEKLAEKPQESLSRQERVRILKAFADAAAYEHAEVAQEAIRRAVPNADPSTVFKARAAVLKVYADLDLNAFVERYEQMPKEQHDAEFTRECEEIVARGTKAFVDSFSAAAGLDERAARDLRAAYDRVRKELDITEQVGGHNFKIRLAMPGTLVSHNGDEIDAEDGGAVVWRFSGEAFRDRAHELSAVSFVPNEKSK